MKFIFCFPVTIEGELRKLDWSEEELKYDMKVSRMTDQEIVEMSYEGGVHYWTEWEIEDEFQD